jgi:hypothetical protein
VRYGISRSASSTRSPRPASDWTRRRSCSAVWASASGSVSRTW